MFLEDVDKHTKQTNITTHVLTSSDGEVLCVDHDIHKRLGLQLPSWRGKHLSAYIPGFGTQQECVRTLQKRAEDTQESPLTGDTSHIKFTVTTLYLTQRGLLHLWQKKQQPPPSKLPPDGEFFWITFISLKPLFETQQTEATSKLRSTIGSIIAGFAHEVRNPLSAILTLVEGVMMPNMESDTLRALGRIPKLVERIEDLIKIALSYGRPRSPRRAWHQLGVLLQQSTELLNQAGILLPQDKLPQQHTDTPVFVDGEQIISVITNLLQNATEEAGHDGVSVQVNTSPKATLSRWQGSFIAIDIIDKGKGIDPSVQDTLFEPFVTTKSKGTGLGLAIARDIARLNRGDVVLLESSRNGSTFRLLLPSYQDQQEEQVQRPS